MSWRCLQIWKYQNEDFLTSTLGGSLGTSEAGRTHRAKLEKDPFFQRSMVPGPVNFHKLGQNLDILGLYHVIPQVLDHPQAAFPCRVRSRPAISPAQVKFQNPNSWRYAKPQRQLKHQVWGEERHGSVSWCFLRTCLQLGGGIPKWC